MNELLGVGEFLSNDLIVNYLILFFFFALNYI